LIAATSSSETAGIPASIRSTPTAASASAIAILSATVNTTPGVCSPSRRVASWICTRGGNENDRRTSSVTLNGLTHH
jgi:hypothetical protein